MGCSILPKKMTFYQISEFCDKASQRKNLRGTFQAKESVNVLMGEELSFVTGEEGARLGMTRNKNGEKSILNGQWKGLNREI